jgi:hypothetical protein
VYPLLVPVELSGFTLSVSSSPLLQASRKLKPKKAKATVGHTSFKKFLLLFNFFFTI